MDEILYTTIEKVRELANENYLTKHKRTAFIDIIRYLDQHKLLSAQPPAFRRAARFLSPEAFSKHVGTQPVNATAVLTTDEPSFIRENNILPLAKDIFMIAHLPYIDTGMHTHDYFEINYVYTGTCYQKFANETRQFQEGDLIMIAPNSPHSVYTDGNCLITSINIRKSTFDKVFWQLFESNHLLSAFFKHSLYGNHTNNYLTFKIEHTRDYQELIQKIFDEATYADDYSNNMCINLVNLLFGKLLREFGNTIHLFDNNKSSSLSADFPIILRYVQHNYATVNLTVLSQVFHYSEVYLSKMFKKHLNQNFSHMLQELRLQHVREYLEYSDYKLADITLMVGYDSVDHLSRTFKKTYGITPSDFRKQCRQPIPASFLQPASPPS